MKAIYMALAGAGLLATHAVAAPITAGEAAQQLSRLLSVQSQPASSGKAIYRTSMHVAPFGSICQATEVAFSLDDAGKVSDVDARPVFHALGTPMTPVPFAETAAEQAATESACTRFQSSDAVFHADSAREAGKGIYVLGRIPIVLPVIPVDCREIDGDCRAGIAAFGVQGLTAISDCGRNEIDNRCWLYSYPTATLEVYVNADYVPFKVIATRTLIAFDPMHH